MAAFQAEEDLDIISELPEGTLDDLYKDFLYTSFLYKFRFILSVPKDFD